MSDVVWALPASLGLLAVLLIAGVVALIVRARRRSPRAIAAATEACDAAAAALERLDDDATALDVAFEAADVFTGDDAPTDLRRARAAALRGRDRGFEEVAALRSSTRLPAQRRADGVRLRADLERRIAATASTRESLTVWAGTHRGVPARISAARARRAEVARTSGDPAPLVADLRARFDGSEWADAERAAREAAVALAAADRALDAAERNAIDLSSAEQHLFEATAAIRRAGRLLRAVEDAHRIVSQAAENAPGEVTTAESEIAAARATAAAEPGAVSPDALERLSATADEVSTARDELDRRPRAAIEIVARARETRDDVLGDIPSPRRRLEAARTALPGTLACARAALASAEAFADAPPISERLRLNEARRALADARAAQDAAEALAHARTAWRAVPREGALSPRALS